ncbi:MAG: RNA polymerase sigma factor [Planctomycetota bacterium]
MTETVNIHIDDTTLVKQCRQGDSEATERLILKYQNRIYNVILKICANADDAAELSQETFVKVIENIDKFEGRSSFYTWLFRIAVNLTLSYCKRSVKLGLKSLDAEDDERNWQGRRVLKDFLSADGSSDPAAIAANKELCELIKKAMMQLDDKQRAVIVLRDIEGMDYAQIAKVLDVELGTVKSRLSRGRSNLREIMEAIS